MHSITSNSCIMSGVRSFVDPERTFAGQPAPTRRRSLAWTPAAVGSNSPSRSSRNSSRLPRNPLRLDHGIRRHRGDLRRGIARRTHRGGPGRHRAALPQPQRARRARLPRRRSTSRGDAARLRSRFDEPISVPWLTHVHRRLFGHLAGRGGQLKTERTSSSASRAAIARFGLRAAPHRRRRRSCSDACMRPRRHRRVGPSVSQTW